MLRLSRRWIPSCVIAMSALMAAIAITPSTAGAQQQASAPDPDVTDTREVTAPAEQFDRIEARLATQATVPVIVGLKARVDDDATTPTERAGNGSAIGDAVSDFAAANPWLGTRDVRRFATVAFVAFEINAEELSQLEQSGTAASIEASVVHEAGLDESTDVVNSPAAVAHSFDGSGQTVAVIDTGVERNHPFIGGRVVEEACFSRGENCNGNTMEQYGVDAAAPCRYHADSRARHARGRDRRRPPRPGLQTSTTTAWPPAPTSSP